MEKRYVVRLTDENRLRVAIQWCFRVADARRKVAHLYPQETLR